ncbi:hypothetical protein B0H13DRAFT_2055545 [Mycena leptocephala]|nr:hypothetical protein B0H13DRAFT_2055545 [Mycena leptocephala]
MFARAAEQYESDDVNEALSLLRGVIHESARFLLLYEDPSVLFAEPLSKTLESVSISSPCTPRKKCKCRESPTAFHALLGTSLFLLGNLIAQDPSLALPNEPSEPATYWLAALDVFETGENLPSRTSGRGCEAPEDWRMAVVWGRTLICVADAALTLQMALTCRLAFRRDRMRRPPASRRIALATTAPHDLLLLAMDHFTRGIFYMPHTVPLPHQVLRLCRSIAHQNSLPCARVLALAERLPAPAERTRWAHDVISRVRGRCWLVVGTARVEDIEAMAEARGWGGGEDGSQNSSVLDSEEAEETREGLEQAVEFFERARGEGAGAVEEDEEQSAELDTFLVEALLTLANFTKQEDKREALGGALEGMGMDES